MSKSLFCTDFDYPKAKLTRPHVITKEGKLLIYCTVNAGIVNGYDEDGYIHRCDWDNLKAIKYNTWSEYREWFKNQDFSNQKETTK